MAVNPTYPGVYIEELPSGVHTIAGVSTSVTAFVGYTPKGPVNQAVQIFDFGGFTRQFGGISTDSEIGYAVQQFFLNGGSEAWIVRVAQGAATASVTLETLVPAITGTQVLDVSASSDGAWGNYVKLDVDYNTSNPDSSFNLTVSQYVRQGAGLALAQSEVYRNLTMDQLSPQYAPSVVNPASKLVQIERDAAVTPAVLNALPAGSSLSDDLASLALPAGLDDSKRFIGVTVDGDGPYEVPIFAAGAPPATLNDLATGIQAAVRAINPGLTRFGSFLAAHETVGAQEFLRLTSGDGGEQSAVVVTNASNNSASQTLLLGRSNHGRERAAAADLRPAQSGTTSGDLADQTAATLGALSLVDRIDVTVQDGATSIASGSFALGTAVSSLAQLAGQLQTQIRAIAPAHPAFQNATVQLTGTHLQIVSSTDNANATMTFANAGAGTLATDLKLDTAAANVQRYALGTGATAGAQTGAASGNDGTAPGATQIIGAPSGKTGMYALEDADLFNILCIPLTGLMSDATGALAISSAAMAYCRTRRAFYIVDAPMTATTLTAIQSWMSAATADDHSAVYFPYVLIPDPANAFRLRAVPPSGTMAGIYARTDTNRGVWKAPAGIEATLANVQDFAYKLTDPENGVLNPLAINCLRSFPIYGRVAWGARTMRGADAQTDQYKYIPIRRLALYIEESLYRGTKWVVFEPNDEPLWAQIRLNVGAFMHDLFTQGAFQGQTPRDAYFVKCDAQTTTPNDQDLGIVNILVGFAPLKPAEFVIIQIQQIASLVQV